MVASAISLIGVGMPPALAKAVGNTVQTLAGVGTSQALGKVIRVNMALLTTAGGATAFTLSDAWAIGDQVTVYNSSATAALIFPPVGGAIDAGSTNASVSLAQNAGLTFTRFTTTSWRTGGAAAGSFTTGTFSGAVTVASLASAGALTSASPTAGLGYVTGAGGAVTQGTNRTTGVTLNTLTGAITLISAAGSATPASFTVTNSAVAATDVVIVNQKSGTDLYEIFVTAVAAGSFRITSFTTGGTTTEQPVFNFAVIKGVAA